MEMGIIYADRDFIVINKPSGIPVHGGDRVRGETVVDFLLEKFPEIKDVGDRAQLGDRARLGGEVKVGSTRLADEARSFRFKREERPGIVHRLDKNTSGVMVVARSQQSFEALKELFQKRLIEKTYLAVVCGQLREKRGVISLPIGRMVKSPLKRGVMDGRNKIRGERKALTVYRVLKEGSEYSLLELKPKTGRMHQLRVHLKAVGHPVACDIIYGGKKVCCPEGIGRQLLHARTLAFSFPAGKRWHFEADLPDDFSVALKQIF